MHILYYWKNIDSDLKSGKIGHFRSDKEKLEAFKAGYPDFIWIFKTPKGRVRDVELLARLAWTDTATEPIYSHTRARRHSLRSEVSEVRLVWFKVERSEYRQDIQLDEAAFSCCCEGKLCRLKRSARTSGSLA